MTTSVRLGRRAKPRLAIAGVALAGALLAAGPAGAVEFVHGLWVPAGEYFARLTLPNAFKMIEEETKGEVKWKLVAGGQLANPKTSFDATRDGLIQAALGISTYVPNLVPSLNTIYSNVVFGDEIVAGSAAALETLTLDCPSCIEEFKAMNAVPLAGWTSSPYQFACREPASSLADLKGRRIRATGGNVALIEMIGAVPVAATLVEAVGLLQRGGMDCTFGIVGWLKSFGYADFAKDVIDYPLGFTGPAIGLMMNRTAWNSLTDPQKTAHLRASAYISAEQILGQFIIENEQIAEELVGTKGVKFVKPTDPEAWKAIEEKFDAVQREKIIADAKGFGVADPGAILDAYAKNRAKWSPIAKEIGRDIGKLNQKIWEEIYSKVDVNKI
jgi:TRAP-type C4-dicarboxylate transport system substrate-binding protein